MLVATSYLVYGERFEPLGDRLFEDNESLLSWLVTTGFYYVGKYEGNRQFVHKDLVDLRVGVDGGSRR